MQNTTNEFSFILKPGLYGVGVFAAHDITAGTYLRLFGEETERNKEEVPESFRIYCVDKGDALLCPVDFGCMPVGWYLNHSATPNTYVKDFDYYASRDIAAEEEIFIDYNTLEEPNNMKKDYYIRHAN